MKKQLKSLSRKGSDGFTIIEVLIVLAIAGLILAIVFLAVPQLQRNARDNSRQNTVSRVKAELDTYSSNNQGTYPFDVTGGKWSDFYTRYIQNPNVNVKDPSTGQGVINSSPSQSPNQSGFSLYGFNLYNANSLPATKGVVHIVYGAKCNGEALQASGSASTNSRAYAVIIGLDRDGTRYCVDNG